MSSFYFLTDFLADLGSAFLHNTISCGKWERGSEREREEGERMSGVGGWEGGRGAEVYYIRQCKGGERERERVERMRGCKGEGSGGADRPAV